MTVRFPNITASSEAEQLQQIKSYLYQLVQELNWALTVLEESQNKEDANGSKL